MGALERMPVPARRGAKCANVRVEDAAADLECTFAESMGSTRENYEQTHSVDGVSGNLRRLAGVAACAARSTIGYSG
jgi:hypothetical protein